MQETHPHPGRLNYLLACFLLSYEVQFSNNETAQLRSAIFKQTTSQLEQVVKQTITYPKSSKASNCTTANNHATLFMPSL